METAPWPELSNSETHKDRLPKNSNSELTSGGRARICSGDMNRICGGGGLGKPHRTLSTNVHRSHRTGKHLVGDCRNLGFAAGTWKHLSKRTGYAGTALKGG